MQRTLVRGAHVHPKRTSDISNGERRKHTCISSAHQNKNNAPLKKTRQRETKRKTYRGGACDAVGVGVGRGREREIGGGVHGHVRRNAGVGVEHGSAANCEQRGKGTFQSGVEEWDRSSVRKKWRRRHEQPLYICGRATQDFFILYGKSRTSSSGTTQALLGSEKRTCRS